VSVADVGGAVNINFFVIVEGGALFIFIKVAKMGVHK
jgi:hypothetical protein